MARVGGDVQWAGSSGRRGAVRLYNHGALEGVAAKRRRIMRSADRAVQRARITWKRTHWSFPGFPAPGGTPSPAQPRGLHPTDDEPHRRGVGLTLEGGVPAAAPSSAFRYGPACDGVAKSRQTAANHGVKSCASRGQTFRRGHQPAQLHLNPPGARRRVRLRASPLAPSMMAILC